MRTFLLGAAIACATWTGLGTASAQLTPTLNVQFRLADALGAPVNDPALDVQFDLYGVDTGGQSVYAEQQVLTVVGGLASASVGVVSPLPAGVLDAPGDLFLAVTVGADSEMVPRFRLGTVGQALRAAVADDVPGKDINPNSLSVGGLLVVDDNGQWVGDPTGLQGPPGMTGPVGPEGPVGPQGVQGESGPVGPQGVPGPTGPAGPTGMPGPIGPTGPAGPTGMPGPIGPTGPAGPTGMQGPIGPTGAQGVPGPTGPAGPTGMQGPIGPTGPTGMKGEKGDPGSPGQPGEQGPPGATGQQGPPGPNVTPFIELRAPGSTPFIDITNNASDDFRIRMIQTANNKLEFQGADPQNFNVGIGIFPQVKLDVAGKVRCTMLTETSDGRLKQDVRPLADALATVLQLEGVSFEFIDHPGLELPDGRQVGFIAQQVAGVLPEVVDVPDDETSFHTVSYSAVVPVLVEAFKEHVTRQEVSLTQLRDQLGRQEALLQAQAARLEALEQAMASMR